LLEAAGASTMRAVGCPPDAEIEVALVSDRTIARLNRQFLNHRGATDVLAFPGSSLPGDPTIGEVVISLDRARAQARAGGWSVREEVVTLLVHAILHLCGYDDHTAVAAARMRARQQALVARVVRRRRMR
jgi:probable rRNA maturation factor